MDKKELYKNLPTSPGIYIMKDREGNIIYVGKAINLRNRVRSYFVRPQNTKGEMLLKKINSIDFVKTHNALQALVLEAEYIKKYQPIFNVKEKDDKSFLFIEVTAEEFPRLQLKRKTDPVKGQRFGPFVVAKEARELLRLIRKIFPFNTHSPQEINTGKPCFYYQLGLCPGTCVGKISKKDYAKVVKHIILLLKGKEDLLLSQLEKEMKRKAEKLEFEKAQKIKRQIDLLKHLDDISLISNDSLSDSSEENRRIEGYDISNISGAYAVGAMVVFYGDKPQKSAYRIFKIKSVNYPNDLAMMEEVIKRRLKHEEWQYPDLMLIDGGEAHINVAKKLLKEQKLSIPVVGIAKGPKRNKNDFYGEVPFWVDKKTLIKVRDEAHRFAIKHHKKLRKKGFLNME